MIDFVTVELSGIVRMWVWDGRSEPQILYEHKTEKPCWYHSVTMSADGQLAVTSHIKGIYLWSMLTGQQIAAVNLDCWAYSASISTELVAVACDDGKIRLYKHDGTLVRSFDGLSILIYDVSFSPDGQQLVAGNYDNTARVWDIINNTVRLTLEHPSTVSGTIWSPCGNSIATTCWDANVRIWDVSDGRQIAILASNSENVKYSSDGKCVATSGF